MNMTVDGFCDHTSGVPDAELHHHYADLLKSAGAALFGRITYQLMEFWKPIAENPTGEKSMDEFAKVIDRVPKIVFSRTLKNLDWETARLANQEIHDEISDLKQNAGNDILICSPGLIVQLTNLRLIDEFQLCIHPVIAGKGLPLFKNVEEEIMLRLKQTKALGSGAVIHYYEPRWN